VFLIVAPLSVLYNWKDELDTWGYFQCVVVHGLRKEEELARIKNGRVEIALTTYETLRLCLDQFNKINWSAVVVDEAHKIKNPESQITQSMKELRCKNRIGLTGTILQNNLEELWCVMDWANPGCLGNLGHFKNNFSDPIEKGQRHSATKRALATGRKTVRALVRKIAPFFLRRTKALIKEQLPKKDDRVVYCSLTDFQQTVYQAVLDTEDVTLLLRSSEKCDCQSGRTRRGCCYQKNSQGVYVKHLYFTYLAILRKVANHAALLQSTSSTSKKQERYVSSVCSKVFQKFPDFVQRCKNEAFEALSDPMYSGKMKVLQKLLKYYLQKRDKVLIFSLSTKLLNILESYCMAEGLDFSRLDGTTKSRERVQIVKEFNSSSHVNLCLVSTMAGGLGLNFVGANVVVLFDPTWNPANDLQAIDRAYRIGQCRDVTVLRLISLGTVEEVIYLRQLYKQQLQCSVVGKESARRYFEAVQGKSVYKGELFGIKNLFRLQTEGTCLTRRILEVRPSIDFTLRLHFVAKYYTAFPVRTFQHKISTVPFQEHGDDTLSKDEAPEENMHVSRIPKGVLDFSSGSETDEELQGPKPKTTNSSAGHGNRSGKAAGGPVHMSLLQHGFSRLLETIKDRQQLREGDCSSSAEGSPFEEEAGDQKIDDTCTGIRTTSCEGNGVARLPESETKPQNKSIGSDRKDRDDGNNILLLKEGDHESDGNSSPENNKASRLKTTVTKVHQFEGCSDESEDVDLEAQICSQRGASNLQNKEDDGGRRKPGRSRRRQSAGARDKARSKFTEAIEAFTSSEDERSAPGRRAGRSEVASFTRLRGSTTPRDGSFILSNYHNSNTNHVHYLCKGRVQEVTYMHSNQRVVGGSRAEELISRAAVRDVFERKMYSQLPANNLLGTQEVCSNKHQAQWLFKFRVRNNIAQQLEEMAQHFKFASVHQFATEILKGSSSHRLDWLCRYYASLNHSDVAEAVRENFPDTTAQPSSPTTAAFSSSTKIGLGQGSRESAVAAFPNHTDRDCPSSSDLRRCSSATLSKPTAQDGEQGIQESSRRTGETSREGSEPPSALCSNTHLKDLIGDTSILDDLLKPKGKNVSGTQNTALVQTSRSARKDIWDILSEGNEERINKLTDPEVVQKVCINTTFAARGFSGQNDSKNLWKTNDKFLWRK
uniref:Excision repair cross-complementation group 6-like 2 n=1 Tax=Poecilia mexicana TaxID=48701 RepID=A0A3B3Y0G0_9TELE